MNGKKHAGRGGVQTRVGAVQAANSRQRRSYKLAPTQLQEMYYWNLTFL